MVSFKERFLRFSPSGSVSVGYEYGFLPFLVSLNPPQGNFKTEGNFQFNALKLPFNATYYYSNVGSISGLNNHFTVKFDAQAYKKQLLEKIKADQLKRIGSIDSLNLERQKLKKKLDYLYLLNDKKISIPVDSTKLNPPDLTINNPLDTNISIEIPSLDSLTPNSPSWSPPLSFSDSIGNLIQNYQSQVSHIEQTIQEYQKWNLQSPDSLLKLDTTLRPPGILGKIGRFFSDVKSFDIGLTYPNYSDFLVSRIPIRGVNVAYEKNKFYIAFTHGKTVNNIFFTNNIVQNNLNAARNLYNFFDFNNTDDGRKVTAAKLGYGSKEQTHVHVGLLYGLGKVSYQDTSFVYESERNLVGEVDLRWNHKGKHLLDAVYGKSSVQVNSINLGEEATLLDKLVDFGENTNAFLGRYTLKAKQTDLKFTFRYIDPFFRSFGVGFLRSDNIRYEIKAKQQISKKLSVGLYFRRENDNLIGLYSYQNVILSYGANASLRPNKHWLLKADIRPLVQQVNAEVDSLNLNNQNYILNGVVSYNNRIKNTYLFLTGVYSYYQLSFDENLNTYQNINVNASVQINSVVTNDLIYNRYQTTDTSATPLSSIIENDFSVNYKKLTLTAVGKYSFTQNKDTDWGLGLRGKLAITKNISWELSFEKLVFGDFYNSIFQQNLEQYPYYFNSKIILRW